MLLTETDLVGSFLIDIEKNEDERGFFARSWCRREFQAHGLDDSLVQCNISYNRSKGTLRGMHWAAPKGEAKLVRCTAGAIHDVIIDLRKDSRTYARHFGVELSARNHRMLFVPDGFAHGFLTLTDDVEVTYQMSDYYEPGNSRGLRWNDPEFAIRWPSAPTTLSERDASYPDFRP